MIKPLDGTDGKQARRTGSSSPLGELFDHGLDSWAALFLPLAVFSALGRSEKFGITVYQMFGLLTLILVLFVSSHWEKYNTGVLFLPWSFDPSQVVSGSFQIFYLN
jgi:ethanolaminephosphotransferase